MSAKTELRKALLSTAGDGAALLPYDLDPVLHEELLKLQPLAQLLDILPAGGLTHEYRLRSSHPLAWFEGESTPMNQKAGAYVAKSVRVKIQRIWGGVTGFAQSMDEAFINALSEELQGSLEGMANVLEYGSMWGISNDIGYTGDAYQYSGIIPRLLAYAPTNVIDGGGAKITLDMLDQALAKVQGFRQVRNDPKMWFMGLRMKQVVDGLQSKVQLPLQSVTLADGKIEMAAYGGAPIFETDFIVPASTSTSPACTAVIGAGGSLPAATHRYKISSITLTGEQVAGTTSANCVNAAANLLNDLSWTADANAFAYMIWREVAAAGVWYLLDIIPALTYDAAGTVNGTVTTYQDTGAKTIGTIKALNSGEQNLLLIDRNPARGAAFVGKVDDMGRAMDGLFSYVDLARTKDSYDYFIKGYLALRLVHPNLVAMVRHAKLA